MKCDHCGVESGSLAGHAGAMLCSSCAPELHGLAEPMKNDPSTEELRAYGEGYVAGLDDAKDQDVAKLIKERDIAKVQLTFERAMRLHLERSLDEVRARCAELEAQLQQAKRNLS